MIAIYYLENVNSICRWKFDINLPKCKQNLTSIRIFQERVLILFQSGLTHLQNYFCYLNCLFINFNLRSFIHTFLSTHAFIFFIFKLFISFSRWLSLPYSAYKMSSVYCNDMIKWAFIVGKRWGGRRYLI